MSLCFKSLHLFTTSQEILKEAFPSDLWLLQKVKNSLLQWNLKKPVSLSGWSFQCFSYLWLYPDLISQPLYKRKSLTEAKLKIFTTFPHNVHSLWDGKEQATFQFSLNWGLKVHALKIQAHLLQLGVRGRKAALPHLDWVLCNSPDPWLILYHSLASLPLYAFQQMFCFSETCDTWSTLQGSWMFAQRL